MVTRLLSIIKFWIPFVIAGTVLCGIIYGTVQQAYRQSANDPQIQMAEDAATALKKGKSPAEIVGQEPINMATSLAPFLIIYDGNGKPLASSATLDNEIPTLPDGVYAYAKQFGSNRLTWQPRPDVRNATVTVYYAGQQSGFVLAGRSLREVEKRESKLTFMVFIGWLFFLFATLLGVIFKELMSSLQGRIKALGQTK